MNLLTARKGVFLLAALVAPYLFLFSYALVTEKNALLAGLLLTPPVLGLLYVLLFHFLAMLPLLLFLVPVSVTSGIDGGFAIALPSELLTAITAMLFTLAVFLLAPLRRDILRHPLTILFFIELGWMLFCSAFSHEPGVSIKRCLVRMAFIMVYYLLAAQWLDNIRHRRWLYILYAAGCVVPILWTIAQHARFGFQLEIAYIVCRPFFTEHTIYGAVLAFLLPGLIILYLHRKTFGITGWAGFGLLLLLLITLAGELLSFSRAAWLSLLVAGFFYLLIRWRVKLRTMLAVLAAGTLLIALNSNTLIDMVRRNEAVSNKGTLAEHVQSVANIQSDASNLERVNRWVAAIRMARVHPVTGFGPGTYQFEYGRFQDRAYMTRISTYTGNRGHAHSEIFNALSETGFPGMILYLVIVFSVIGYGLRVIARSKDKAEQLLATAALLSLMTYYIHGLFNAFLDTDKMASLTFCSIAVIMLTDLRQRKTITAEPERT